MTATYPLLYYIQGRIFVQLFLLIMFEVTPRTSECAAYKGVKVNPFNRTVQYSFANGRTYLYKNVSRISILNLMFNDVISLGLWVQSLVNNSRRENRYNVQTGALTYRECGFSPYTDRYINY